MMSITFSCPACGRSFSVDDRMAGKRGKCKSCGGLIQIPQPATAPSGPSVADLYGLDEPAAPVSGDRAGVGDLYDDGPPRLPERPGGRGPGKPKRKKGGGDGPWGVGIRNAAGSFAIGGLFVFRLLRMVPEEYKTHHAVVLISLAALSSMLLGVLLTVISVVGASVSLFGGNSRAFAVEGAGDGIGWVCACLFSILFLGGAIFGITHATWPTRMRPGGPQAGAPRPGAPAGGGPGLAASGPEIRSDIRVVLSNGQFMRNTSMIGTARPGVGISVDYQVEKGELAGLENFVLVIKSRTGRGELDNLNEMRMRGSGTIHASSFMASPQEGPYEAWVEVSSLPGGQGRRKRVSDPISLQFTDVPVRDLAAENQARLDEQRRQMDEQQRRMMNPPPMMNPPQMPPFGPRFPGPAGPMGPRGGRFGPR